jgi:transposase
MELTRLLEKLKLDYLEAQLDAVCESAPSGSLLVDQGYLETNLLVSCQQRGIDLVGPMPSSKSWQDRQDGAFDHTMFTIDWAQRVATCPAGKTSRSCSNRQTWRGTLNLHFAFSPADCLPCTFRPNCSQANGVGRTLTIYPEMEYKALLAARARRATDEFKTLYAQRAGIEGTISQAVRRMDLRRCRCTGLARTHLQHLATAAAINVVRIVAWLTGARSAHSRLSPLVTRRSKILP